jgi:hypothetical protein
MGRRSGDFTGRSIDNSVSALRFEYYTNYEDIRCEENTCDATCNEVGDSLVFLTQRRVISVGGVVAKDERARGRGRKDIGGDADF